MVSIRRASARLTQLAVCGIFRAADPLNDYLSNALSRLPGVGPTDNDANDAMADMFCPEDATDVPTITFPSPPFTGGQCPVEYTVRVVNDRFINGSLAQEGEEIIAPFGVLGPITSIAFNASSSKVKINYGGGLSTEIPTGSQPGGTSRTNLRGITVTRRDGQADTCGSLPAPGRPNFTTNIIYDNSNGVEINAPVTVSFQVPIIGVNGNLSIPLSIVGPSINLSPTFNFSTGDVTFGLDLGDRTGEGCDPPFDPPDVPEAPGEPAGEPQRFFRAMIVVSTGDLENSIATTLPAGNGVNLYGPRLGTLSIRVRIGKTFAFLPDISIKHVRQLVIIPENFVGNGYAAHPIPGVNFELFPVYLRNYNAPDQ